MAKRNKNTTKNNFIGEYLHTHRLDWLEITAMILSLWFIMFPGPFYHLLAAALIVIPILGLVLNGLYKPSIASLVTISMSDKYKYDIADFIDLPAIAICIRAISDYEFEDFYTLIIPGTIALILTMALLLFTHNMKIKKNERDHIFTIVLIFVCLFVYSYGATYMINCAFDTSQAKMFDVKVLDKRHTTSHGKHGTHHHYYLRVAPWGHHYDTEEISVSRDQFNNSDTGDMVSIGLHKGLLNIPWYRLE